VFNVIASYSTSLFTWGHSKISIIRQFLWTATLARHCVGKNRCTAHASLITWCV